MTNLTKSQRHKPARIEQKNFESYIAEIELVAVIKTLLKECEFKGWMESGGVEAKLVLITEDGIEHNVEVLEPTTIRVVEKID